MSNNDLKTKAAILPEGHKLSDVTIDLSHATRLKDKLDAAKREAIFEAHGQEYMRGPRGELMPISSIQAQDKLIDEQVRKIFVFADDLSQQIARFKEHCFEDLNQLQSLLEQEYGARKGGAKGNVQYLSYDGLLKVVIQMADQITYGPELQVAKTIIDECLLEWGATSHEFIRPLVNQVFSVEKQGIINRADLYSLTRVEIDDPRWNEAMRAIKDAERVRSTKAYIRFYKRPNITSKFQAISLDIANAEVQS